MAQSARVTAFGELRGGADALQFGGVHLLRTYDDPVALRAEIDAARPLLLDALPALGAPALLFVAFQAGFAMVTVALIAGAVADRMRFVSWLVFAALWATLVYFPVAHWVFSFDGVTAEAVIGQVLLDVPPPTRRGTTGGTITITITRIWVPRVAVFRWMPGTRAVARATASELTSHLQSMDPFYPLQLSGS